MILFKITSKVLCFISTSEKGIKTASKNHFAVWYIQNGGKTEVFIALRRLKK